MKRRRIIIQIGSIKVLCYNTSICYKLHGKVFKDFVKNARKDRYNLMCSIIAHDKQQPIYFDDGNISVGIQIHKNATT